MKILLTGGSSFTGMWFAKALAAAGHEVVCPLKRSAYEGLRRERVEQLEGCVRVVPGCPYGGEEFLQLVRGEEGWDAFCHHAAEVHGYKEFLFDVPHALYNNTGQLPVVLQALEGKGCGQVILTGSYFEPREGVGSEEVRAVSPYGLSKAFTAEMFAFYCQHYGLSLKKFVIPNPFGPFEGEERFTAFLARSWLEEKPVIVSHGEYVRDNIHVGLLAQAYWKFVEGEERVCRPSGYPEPQGVFVRRFAEEMQRRWQLPCEFEVPKQTDFSEPRVRINSDFLDPVALNWSETEAWDQLADYYQTKVACP
ncbi:MAG: NAD(P)-dependent oxidoreductase [Chlamydiia bacterium]|nr:NAD(P)-dependent oxidoreductase [Chlamydiia bacterium]